MKKFKYLFFSLVLVTSIISCDEGPNEDNFKSDSQSGWVQFRDSNVSNGVFGFFTEVTVPLDLNSPVNKDGLEVSYVIQDVTGSSNGIIPQSGTVSFAKGELVSNLVLPILQTSNSAVEFDIVLTTTSRDNVTIGLSDESTPVVKRVKICGGVDFSNVTSYTGASSLGADSDFTPFTPTVTMISPTELSFSTFWGPNFIAEVIGNPALANNYFYSGVLTINPDLTVTIVGNNTAAWDNGGGTGVYDPCTRTFSYRLNQTLFTSGGQPAPVDVVITLN